MDEPVHMETLGNKDLNSTMKSWNKITSRFPFITNVSLVYMHTIVLVSTWPGQ